MAVIPRRILKHQDPYREDADTGAGNAEASVCHDPFGADAAAGPAASLSTACSTPFASLITGAIAGLRIAATVTIMVEDLLVQAVADVIVLVVLGRIFIGAPAGKSPNICSGKPNLASAPPR